MASQTTPTRNVRRRAGNRQAAFSFLSTIQLDPSTNTPAGVANSAPGPAQENGEQEADSIRRDSLQVDQSDSTDQGGDATMPRSEMSLAPSLSAPSSAGKKGYIQRKEDMATTFLAGLSLRGAGETDVATASNEDESTNMSGAGVGRDSGIDDMTGLRRPSRADLPSQGHPEIMIPLQRSNSSPSLSPGRNRRSSSANILESTDHGRRPGRQRKTTSPGALPSPTFSSNSPRSSKPNRGTGRDSSSGLLSVLLAREKTADSTSDSTSGFSQRQLALQKSPSRWLSPISDHVQLKPLIVHGTAHIVKKIFRRPSVSHHRRFTGHGQGSGTHDHTTRSSRSTARGGGQILPRQVYSQDENQRHIFYKGGDISNSCVSLGENLSQHAFMFTTQRGSPLIVSSILRYNDDRAPNKRRRRRFDREYLQQITKEALIRRKANSFAHLLTQSNALEPEPQDSKDSSTYDPYYLDDPELKTGKNRTVISLACYMGSVIQYTRPSDLKRELNEHFRTRHPTIDPAITLSKIRKVKSDLLAISEELDLEISTAALAYAYFEKLVMKGSWRGKDSGSLSTESTPSPVNKENRKLMACVCLLLAYKVNEPKRPSGEFATLMKTMTKHMYVSVKDIKEHEFQVFSLLEFNLYIPRQEFLPHFEQILYRQDYINVQEYLGEDEFYSIVPRKPAD
ncbi:hypothetical protein EMPS_00889 [Entomortierella parvispora]|uniref:Cyclin N-terminal domain-containing protein n=1 Tax=Entomortierella parvispora TaxID=205924 RepID=A0A9P3LS28_9FUNG|nr:hypothetical protein EMPS_00889 [Entomortierella parvispora]